MDQYISDQSRVWVYPSNREFTSEELVWLQKQLFHFTKQWTAHNQQLTAKAEIRYKRFLILMVDETAAGASGCSIDKSVHFMQEIERTLGINLFDRMQFAYKLNDEVATANKVEFEQLIADGIITKNTIVFNNLVGTKADLDSKWEVKLADSWHANFFFESLNKIPV